MSRDARETAILGLFIVVLLVSVLTATMWFVTSIGRMAGEVPQSHSPVCAMEEVPGHPGDYSIQRYTDAEGVRGPIVACP